MRNENKCCNHPKMIGDLSSYQSGSSLLLPIRLPIWSSPVLKKQLGETGSPQQENKMAMENSTSPISATTTTTPPISRDSETSSWVSNPSTRSQTGHSESNWNSDPKYSNPIPTDSNPAPTDSNLGPTVSNPGPTDSNPVPTDPRPKNQLKNVVWVPSGRDVISETAPLLPMPAESSQVIG